MKSFLMNLLLTIANTADNLASKLATNEPEPLLDYAQRGYEPAGIIHYGELCQTWEQAHRRADHHARQHESR